MKPRLTRMIVAVAAIVVLALGGAAWAIAGGGDDDGPSATGPGADKARAAAIAHVGGRANAVERESEDGAVWEVEVTKADGSTVDVLLDASYGIVTVEGDSESDDENESENEEK